MYLRTAIIGLCQYPADGIRDTSNSSLLFQAILHINRCEKGATIVPVTNKCQFDGVEQCTCTHK